MNKKGFTLIELLIVIAIIGILAVAFLPSLLDAPSKGRDAQRLATIQKINSFMVTQVLAVSDFSDATFVSACLGATAPEVPDTGASNYPQLLAESIADFGGVYPSDPSETNPATGAAAPLDCNGYGIIEFDATVPYTYGIYVAVENAENANILCNGIAAATNPTLGGTITPTVDTFGCYLSLVQ